MNRKITDKLIEQYKWVKNAGGSVTGFARSKGTSLSAIRRAMKDRGLV